MAAVANKEARQLNQEDYGRASGMLEVLQSIAPPTGHVTVILPDGHRSELTEFTHEGVLQQIRGAITGWQVAFSLTPEQVAAVVISAIVESTRGDSAPVPADGQPFGVSEGVES